MYKGYKNKGLYYRDKNRERKNKILHKIREKQQGACFFAKVLNPKTGFLYGETHFFGRETLFGLIIENKLYYTANDNTTHFVYANKRGFKIIKIYDNIPEWASNELIEKYNYFNLTK